VSRDSFELLCALFFWEVSVNGMSARIMAAVVKDAPAFTSRYINLAILLGAATGPVINGFLVSTGHAYVYVLLGTVTAFAPALWIWALGEGERAGAQLTLLQASR
jgi:predicted ABC-type sugar transport system permease subunit